MMMKKRLLALGMAGVMAFSLAGCRSAELQQLRRQPQTQLLQPLQQKAERRTQLRKLRQRRLLLILRLVSSQVLLPRVMRKSHRPTR